MSRNPKELADLEQFCPGRLMTGSWMIAEMLDEGGFGRVYKVYDTTDPSKVAALKIESTNMQGGSAIKLEVSALKQIHLKKQRTHATTLFKAGKRGNICYMIVTLLGMNLDRLKRRFFCNGIPARTWVRLAIQCLYGVKSVHDSAFVHRDLKAANFVLGHSSDRLKARIVHIVDFGLARQYATFKNNKWVARKARPWCEFRGTWCYAAPSMHNGKEQGRKDDLMSLLYMLIDLYADLPWENEDEAGIARIKQNIRNEDLLMKMPKGLLPVIQYLRTLDYYSTPDYTIFYNALLAIMKKANVSFSDPYEWESGEDARLNRATMFEQHYEFVERAAEFFAVSDVSVVLPTETETTEGKDATTKDRSMSGGKSGMDDGCGGVSKTPLKKKKSRLSVDELEKPAKSLDLSSPLPPSPLKMAAGARKPGSRIFMA